MLDITNDQYFLILEDLDLFPEIKPNTIAMIEQIMNAQILLNKDNIQQGVTRALDIEYYCRPFITEHYLTLLNRLRPMLQEFHITIIQGEQVKCLYPSYHDRTKYYWDIGKQSLINNDFAVLKKLSYNGKDIIWEHTYIQWVEKIMMDREEQTQHKPSDTLINTHIFQKVEDLRYAIRDVILDETQRYAQQYQQHLQNAQTASVQ